MHTLIPAMLLHDGVPHTVLGTMGGHGQAQTHLQLLSNLVDFGMEPQEAVEAPRWLSGQATPEDVFHVLRIEDRIGPDVVDGLRERGHDVLLTEPWAHMMGHAHMIQIDRQRGILKGGSDPRADGAALGW
jgi:gamma-glutamyltranspeptidase/glutathione hydrolase